MSLATFTHDPNSRIDYTINWASWLAAGETISSVVWEVPSPLVKVSQVNTTTAATARIEGGEVGNTYEVVCRITTNLGQIEDRTIKLKVKEK
jgi:hypothetical protein